MISLKNVFLAYNKDYYALYDINLEINAGARLALVGTEGSGKTSLLRAIAGLEPNLTGELYIKNIPIKKLDFAYDIALAYLSSKPVFLEHKTVSANLEYILALRNKQKAVFDNEIKEALTKFGIFHLVDKRVDVLSDTERKLVQIARAGLRKLDVLLVDNGFEHSSKADAELIISALKLLAKPKEIAVVIGTEKPEMVSELVKETKYMRSGSMYNTKEQADEQH
ncbi:MAG: ATP-binding cassette domain-containing protein [Firmicutes bacterium]|nr:ATP-binding cassette domain-containing protein [Bacillota bacterium]